MSPTRPARRVTAARGAAAALGVALAAALGACTAPDGGTSPAPALDATISAGGGGAVETPTEPTAPAEESTLAVRAADGTETWVSAGSSDLLADVPVEIPLVAGDADLVQISAPADPAASTYHVVIVSPGTPTAVFADVVAEFGAAGFTTEDVAPEEGTPVGTTAAAVFTGGGHRVTVGLVPAGRTSTTVTYVIVPAA